MKEFLTVKLNHANLNRPVYIMLGSICGFHESKNEDGFRIGTNIYCKGMNVFPVKENEEQIQESIKLKIKEYNNGTKKAK